MVAGLEYCTREKWYAGDILGCKGMQGMAVEVVVIVAVVSVMTIMLMEVMMIMIIRVQKVSREIRTIQHANVACRPLNQGDSTHSHNQVVNIVYQELAKKSGLSTENYRHILNMSHNLCYRTHILNFTMTAPIVVHV
jgi:hypothetical protein